MAKLEPDQTGRDLQHPDPRPRALLLEQFRHRPDHGVRAVWRARALVSCPGEGPELVFELGEMAGEAGSAGNDEQEPGRSEPYSSFVRLNEDGMPNDKVSGTKNAS